MQRKKESATVRRLRARAAAYERWARCPDRAEATRPAREALWRRFEREVDPDGVLAPEERHKRAQAAMRRHMCLMAAKRHAT